MEQYITFFSNHPVLSIIWVVLAIMLVHSWYKSRFSAIRPINPQQLTLLINKDDAQVLDMRGKKDFIAGRIAGAEMMNVDKAKQNDFGGLEKYKTKPIILVCNTGMTANNIAERMHQQGYEQVYVLSGGMSSWQSAGLPTTNGK
ncbi:rhodanese-like domain-containing protein [Pseudoalteromonas luteoviolacea]|uniref:Rhodanese domain-containing protein n=1 Tax=Pseudoalteromonas luteoviolacea NCIMB 1942 TaxID=1365253 RepID=A0A166Y6A3_9GAMM|nr:rhodanese-like domain-containing protein [Pseudoalteromonas luteoviolacea]KZN41487.1 hypothetical protein N482_04065 [Pseudoalteromonas luteoviolacea NCIMB 1942]KZX01146.1 hypothetical protein JL49_07820 [Pseudoalteromonas luteoviolacea]